jgi:hypothetical protein
MPASFGESMSPTVKHVSHPFAPRIRAWAVSVFVGAPLLVSLGLASGCSSSSDDEPVAKAAQADRIEGRTIRTQLPGARCIDVVGMSTADGAPVQLYDCWGGANQVWYYNDTFGPSTILGPDSYKCLDASGQSNPPNGTAVQLHQCTASPSQLWSYDDLTGEMRLAGTNKCLDATNQSGTNGTLLQVYDCWGGENQRWTFGDPASDPCLAITADATWSGFGSQDFYSGSASYANRQCQAYVLDISSPGAIVTGTKVEFARDFNLSPPINIGDCGGTELVANVWGYTAQNEWTLIYTHSSEADIWYRNPTTPVILDAGFVIPDDGGVCIPDGIERTPRLGSMGFAPFQVLPTSASSYTKIRIALSASGAAPTRPVALWVRATTPPCVLGPRFHCVT